LIAVVREHPRPGAEREPERQHRAGRFLRELADVADVRLENLRAARDVAIEEERLGERQRVVLRARAALDRHQQALAASEEVRRLERQLTEHAFELRHAGAEGQ